MSPSPSRIPLGIACVMGGIFSLTVSDTLAKWLGHIYSPMQIVFLRGGIATLALLILAGQLGGRQALLTSHLGVHLLRGALNVLTAYCFYLSLTFLPQAEATAIAFSAPFFVTIISVIFLKEKVALAGWLALLTGFAGVLLVVRPSPDHMQWAALLPLLTALGYAVMMTTARYIKAQESMLTMMLYLGVGQAVFAGPLSAWIWVPVQAEHWLGFAGIAFFSTVGLGLITQAFRVAPASIVAPFDYSGLIWATLFGWVIWHEVPSTWFYAGALLIAGSGIYVALFSGRNKT
ncbi:DMT family transporter [Pusillimonas sp. CC-YST705]|uniref:DMT family transporter n=1 Tax=Mesopusillimonas faecipullorum TaxID=2755040 RepID=A0ABS8CDI6_9BURK|nr:DMT family transporter [Mesopusillimonas faecipullorum]MCB5363889.1 DMT family transporter [Mesopusillimonas faecipullorum]